MVAKASANQRPQHLPACRGVKAVFGLLVLIVGLYAVAGDLGALGSKIPVSPWWLLVVIVGLFWLLKSAAGGKCPACR
ncbi:MAG: hypothetical protein HY512_00585 [Candidatus Aenigmarchaeota archaeon]|nr:hypothetical protein [Candidatus Aenigmarchaeota archaeon]